MPDEKDHGKTLISWEFPEYIKHERGRNWLIGAILIGGSLFVFVFFTANFLFGVILVIAAIIMFLHHRGEPDMINFSILEDGLELGEKFYAYKDIKNFWIIYEPPKVKSLYFDFKNVFRPRLNLPLENINPLKIRETLLNYLEEDLEQENEPPTDGLARWLKL